ncbi:winged helix-turn-helix domain-containing protein [Plantactinospora sp. B5E13]|uniref:ArsR/SmtB family transcription factor n=1 Tax=unclassified Plantactinospora TaxID=2631981 RepID=UPI00325C90A5
MADETRAALCLALLDGRAWTASELAARAEVAPSTATAHLHRLVDGGLLVERRQGRHRYVQLAGSSVAQLIEDLAARTDPRPTLARGLRAVTASAALRRGRTCYDHLAGRLGVAVTDAMTGAGLLNQTGGFAITSAGVAGAKLAGAFFGNGRLTRIGSGRAVRLTPAGGAALHDLLRLADLG